MKSKVLFFGLLLCACEAPVPPPTPKSETSRCEIPVFIQAESRPCPGLAGRDKIICVGDYTRLGCPEKEESGYCYLWEPEYGMQGEENLYSSYPLVRPFISTVYLVTVTDAEGNEVGRDEVLVDVFLKDLPYISPRIFCGPY